MKNLIRKILKEEIEFNYDQDDLDKVDKWELEKEGRRFSENIIEIATHVNDEKIKEYKSRYPNKWILYNTELERIWIKDKPKLFWGTLPEKVYHVSKNPNLGEIGIKPSTQNSTPFGYYDISFFYLNFDDAFYGSKPHLEGKNNLYEITTNIPDIKWYEGFNEPIDSEENITTNSFINPFFIKKIR